MPRPRPTSSSSLLVLALMTGWGAGCAAKSTTKATRAADGAAPTRVEADDPDALEAELSDYESRLRAAGLGGPDAEGADAVVEAGEAEPTPAATDDRDRCTNICDLAEAICGLRTRVCALADQHPGEPRYAEVCRRAGEDCELATGACEGCE